MIEKKKPTLFFYVRTQLDTDESKLDSSSCIHKEEEKYFIDPMGKLSLDSCQTVHVSYYGFSESCLRTTRHVAKRNWKSNC